MVPRSQNRDLGHPVCGSVGKTQRQLQQQIPKGNDRKKCKGNDRSKGNDKGTCIGLWVLLFRLEEVGDDLDDESWLALEDDVAAAGDEC